MNSGHPKYILELEIEGLPKTTNQLLGASWRVRAGHAKTWERKVWKHCWHLKPESPLATAKLTLIRRSSKLPDYDGLVGSFKAVLDALIKCEIIVDDNHSVVGVPTYKHELVGPNKSSIKVKVEEL